MFLWHSYHYYCKLSLPFSFRFYCQTKLNNNGIKSIETIRNLLFKEPSDQLYKGWIRGRIRRHKTHWFLHIDDGSSVNYLQVIIPKSLICESNKIQIYNGASIECIGKLTKSLGSQQLTDFHCQTFRIIGNCSPNDYQIGHLKSETEFDFLREQIHLRPRVRFFQSILRIRNELTKALHRFMEKNGFIQVQVPMITTNDCEGGGECFSLTPVNWPKDANQKPYFGRPTYLTVSGQLHLEALASSLSRVYTLSPVFRAEKSMSPKHLSEFLMLEVEQAFIFDLSSLIDRVESLIKFLIVEIEQHCPKDLEFLLDMNKYHENFEKIKNLNFLRISYQDACQILSEQYPQFQNIHSNLNFQMECYLLKKFDNRPIFVINFPTELKPFYMKSSENGSTVQCFDLLSPICGEICGGSLREDSLDRLHRQILSKQMIPNQLEWYMDLRRFGSAPSGGFGLGFDRFLQTITGIQNIKDVVPFPRWPYHCYL